MGDRGHARAPTSRPPGVIRPCATCSPSSWPRPASASRSGRPAPAEVRRLAPDLVLPDVPPAVVGPGWEALAGLKADPATAAIPVLVLMTAAHEGEATAGRVGRLGVAVVPKPFGVRDLLARVRAAVGGRPARPPGFAA